MGGRTFAKAHGLPIVRVLAPEGEDAHAPLEEAYSGPGRLVNSGFLDGLTVDEAKTRVAEWLDACSERDSVREELAVVAAM